MCFQVHHPNYFIFWDRRINVIAKAKRFCKQTKSNPEKLKCMEHAEHKKVRLEDVNGEFGYVGLDFIMFTAK